MKKSELQAKIISDFLMENLKKWRKDMDDYREKMHDIRKDVKVEIFQRLLKIILFFIKEILSNVCFKAFLSCR